MRTTRTMTIIPQKSRQIRLATDLRRSRPVLRHRAAIASAIHRVCREAPAAPARLVQGAGGQAGIIPVATACLRAEVGAAVAPAAALVGTIHRGATVRAVVALAVLAAVLVGTIRKGAIVRHRAVVALVAAVRAVRAALIAPALRAAIHR